MRGASGAYKLYLKLFSSRLHAPNLADFHISSGVSFEGRFVKQIGTWLLHKAATPSTRPRPHTVPIPHHG